MSERDNRMMWDGRPLHYEVWFLTATHRASNTGFWIRHVVESPRIGDGDAYAQLWFSRFSAGDPAATFGVSKKLPAVAVTSVADPFSVRLGDAVCRHDGWTGGLRTPQSGALSAHDISWDLAWRPGFTTHHNFFSLGYKLPIADSKILSPNPQIALRGHILVDGERYDFDGDPGQQSHVWGRKHTYQWAWGHCAAFDDAPSALFVGNAGHVKRGQVILPRWTMFSLHVDGETYDFREPWTIPLARSDWGTGFFHLLGVNANARIEARFACRPDDMLLAEYLDPDGDPAFNHITCVADLEVEVKRRSALWGRWLDHRKLRATRAAAFEWAGRAGDVMRVRKVVQHY